MQSSMCRRRIARDTDCRATRAIDGAGTDAATIRIDDTVR